MKKQLIIESMFKLYKVDSKEEPEKMTVSLIDTSLGNAIYKVLKRYRIKGKQEVAFIHTIPIAEVDENGFINWYER